jgi:hypothetical protein
VQTRGNEYAAYGHINFLITTMLPACALASDNTPATYFWTILGSGDIVASSWTKSTIRYSVVGKQGPLVSSLIAGYMRVLSAMTAKHIDTGSPADVIFVVEPDIVDDLYRKAGVLKALGLTD